MEIGKSGQCAVVGRTVPDKGQAVFWRGQTAFVAVESNNWRMLPKAGVRACGEPVTGSRCPDWGDSGLYREPTRGSSSSRKCIESDLLQGADWAGSRLRRTAGLRKHKPPVGVAVRKILPQYLFLGRSQETTRGMAVGPESSPHHGIGDRLPGDRVGDSAAYPSRCVGHCGTTEGTASTEEGGRE